jgi:hypothetical protein
MTKQFDIVLKDLLLVKPPTPKPKPVPVPIVVIPEPEPEPKTNDKVYFNTLAVVTAAVSGVGVLLLILIYVVDKNTRLVTTPRDNSISSIKI